MVDDTYVIDGWSGFGINFWGFFLLSIFNRLGRRLYHLSCNEIFDACYKSVLFRVLGCNM